ncbi:hypothetical protein SAMN04487995_4174 [Dyadobacter koreensis]|uniref:Uncharacterized protein n=1 Tax=Dyadobacter koreensis TaxID=408657 RepID=A0A1H6Y474_9BACT|nr:hypothetical protein [Dyadobacter koreensis]SEJ31930.1 hypothetical protein SAMN04487995_4174 [Dyadobacter koreensis]
MENQKEREIKELQEKIMAKRQQVEFEKTEIDLNTEFASENRENPDVSEEFKNFYDPAGNVIERGELKELSDAEEDLIRLIDRLNKLIHQEN